MGGALEAEYELMRRGWRAWWEERPEWVQILRGDGFFEDMKGRCEEWDPVGPREAVEA